MTFGDFELVSYPMDTLAFTRTFVREAIDRERCSLEHDPKIAAGFIRDHNGRKSVERAL